MHTDVERKLSKLHTDLRKRLLQRFTDEAFSTFLPATGTTTTTTTTNGGSAAGVGGGDNYHFKTLVPSVAAGAIIGKGGETIASLQKDAGARVKMSKAHDFYPGKTLLATLAV